MLETGPAAAEVVSEWQSRVAAMLAALGWPRGEIVAARHQRAMSLAFSAPADRLLTATEINEWAWIGAAGLPAPASPGFPAAEDFDSALHTLRAAAAAEARPRQLQLQDQARAHGLPCLVDDEALSLGAGDGSRSWPLDSLPDSPDWSLLHDVPTALVTGSNGKTTTVRLVAAMLAAAGRRVGFNCTDGVFVDGDRVQRGDYSGPGGAREVLRQLRVQAAVLECARGGLLRRGLAVQHAHAAIVTNVSADHFGEYGVESLEDLADAKLVVARAIGADGVLVLNADDPVLRQRAVRLDCPLAWFSVAGDVPPRDGKGMDCVLRDGRLWLRVGERLTDLGEVAAMPLSLGGAARYNLANLAGASLVAAALGVAPTAIAQVLAHFGAQRHDNPGRLERWRIGEAWVVLDYAHNPEGLQGLLEVAEGLRGSTGRLGLLLGQAGNREDADIARLARVAASARPARVVLKDIAGYLRGREDGEVAALLAAELEAAGVAPRDIAVELSEADAAQALVEWSGPGDVVVLPVHNLEARDQLAAWLDQQAADR